MRVRKAAHRRLGRRVNERRRVGAAAAADFDAPGQPKKSSRLVSSLRRDLLDSVTDPVLKRRRSKELQAVASSKGSPFSRHPQRRADATMAEWSGVRMTKKYLVELCQRHDGYRTPSVLEEALPPPTRPPDCSRRVEGPQGGSGASRCCGCRRTAGGEARRVFGHALLRNIAAHHENCTKLKA